MAPPAAARNFQQHQPITTALRQICESYPAGTCLRELLQNADDAEATEIEYVLDTETYDEGPFLYEGLKQFQGPALLARNNKTFTDKDFASLSSIGDSRKRHDAAATGKFGQGFNSCYHWTDGPWIYSRNWLLFLDPHENWSKPTGQPGGPTWDVVENKDSEELQNHLKTFKAFSPDTSLPMDGTIIRIPLRTGAQAAASKIVQKEVTIEHIKEALALLGKEVRQGGLLFLKHVRKMTVRVDDEVMWEVHMHERELEHRSVRTELTADFRSLYVQGCIKPDLDKVSKSFTIEMIYREGAETVSIPYLVQHLMQRSSGNEDLDNWARSKKLFPWVAIGAPLEQTDTPEPFNGQLFSILRLPLETSQPVHIHGLFSITPDRGRLSSSGQTPGYEDMEVKWNTFMFETCVAEAWAALLESRNATSWMEEGFSLWPRVESSPTELWTKLDDFLLDKIMSRDSRVWNTAYRCVTATEGLFSSLEGDVAAIYSKALDATRLPAVYLKQSLLNKAIASAVKLSRSLQLLSPGKVRSYLRSNKSAIPKNISPMVLEYCMLYSMQGIFTTAAKKAHYEDLKPIPLWPTVGGALKALAEGTLILPRDIEERNLFAGSRSGITIDIEKLSHKVKTAFRSDVASGICGLARLRTLADLALDWPHVYGSPMEGDPATQAFAIRNTNLDSLLHRMWTWIQLRFKDEKQLLSVLDDLWIMPTKGDRIRLWRPGDNTPSILIIEPTELLYGLLDLDRPSSSAHILECQLLPAEAIELLRQQVKINSASHIASSQHFQSLVQWLSSNVELISRMSHTKTKKLLQELKRLARSELSTINEPTNDAAWKETAGLLKRLPIFSRQSAEAPYKIWETTTSDMLADQYAVQLPKGLPPICAIKDMGFYAPLSSSEQYLCTEFKLLEEMSLEKLLFHFILPEICKTRPLNSQVPIHALADFALQNSSQPSQSWVKEIKTFPIIPLRSRDPEQPERFERLSTVIDSKSSMATLYFDFEDVWPEPRFYKRHRHALSACEMTSTATFHTAVERAKFYSGYHDLQQLVPRVRGLLAMALDFSTPTPDSQLLEIVDLPWLPVKRYNEESLTLLSPSQCRCSDDAALVDCILGVVDSTVLECWKDLFGWQKPIDIEVLNAQLGICLEKRRYHEVDAVLLYMFKKYGCESLRTKRCILSKRREYVFPHSAFLSSSVLEEFPMSPYLEEIDKDFAGIHSSLLLSLGVRQKPNLADLLKVQGAILTAGEGAIKDDTQLQIIIRSLEVASRLLEDKEIAQCKAPDTQRKLLSLDDLVYGSRSVDASNAKLNFVHPSLPGTLVQSLGIESVENRIVRDQIETDDEDDDEYIPSERLTTIIEDTLGRYPVTSTFSEFLANAEDCKASQISWILDRCDGGPYSTDILLTSEMKALQGPALFSYNDQIFTDQDFEGYKDIGRGGKTGNIDSIGLFGRGSMSMYHFTNNPMILSDKWLLIVDPYQQLLPRNKYRKRKVGVKLLLETVRRLSLDLLRPFHGLCSYSMDTDCYQGTLFRLPLKGDSKAEHALNGLGIDNLLQKYHDIARESLLFLSHVRSISYGIRGQMDSGWSIQAKHAEGSEQVTFQQVKLSGVQHGKPSFDEAWHVGLYDLDEAPSNIFRPTVSKIKVIECGVAARLPQKSAALEIAEHTPAKAKFYSKLPTEYKTELPVAIHATFAVTGDRRTISVDDEKDPNASWNKWLLETCIPDLYINFLKDLAPKIGQDTFDLWPTKSLSGSLTTIVQKSFWEKVVNGKYKLYPLYPIVEASSFSSRSTMLHSRGSGRRKPREVVALESAEFDFLPAKVSSELQRLFIRLCPGLVRPPPKFRRYLAGDSESTVTTLDHVYLSKLFQHEEKCKILAGFLDDESKQSPKLRIKALEMVLLELVPAIQGDDKTTLHILDGCRVLPKLDGSLVHLRYSKKETRPPPDDWVLRPTVEESQLFCFAPESFVDKNLFAEDSIISTAAKSISSRNAIADLQKAGFNIRNTTLRDIGRLVMHPSSPLRNLPDPLPGDDWFSRFWAYLNRRTIECGKPESDHVATVNEILDATGLEDSTIYRLKFGAEWQYFTQGQLNAQPFVVRPDEASHAKICSELSLIKTIERNHIPTIWASAEPNFHQAAALVRLFAAIEKAEGMTKKDMTSVLRADLSAQSIEVLRGLVLKSAGVDDPLRGHKMFHEVPLWPRQTALACESASRFLSAKEATFCGYPELLTPWTQDVQYFVDAKFVTTYKAALKQLGFELLTAARIWHKHIEKWLPRHVETESLGTYSNMIGRLMCEDVLSQANITPDGNGRLCSADSLYDHDEAIFVAAFNVAKERKIRFIHPDFRRFRIYFVKLGLRTRVSAQVTGVDFVECAKSIQARSSRVPIDGNFRNDTRKLAEYLQYDKQCFRSWEKSHWEYISNVRMFVVKIGFPTDGAYREARVRALSYKSEHCSMRQAGRRSHRRIQWSQVPFLEEPPANYIYEQLPDCGSPTTTSVYEHLTYLIELHDQIHQRDVAEYLQDIQACYAFLQDNISSTPNIPGIKTAAIWLNLNTTEVETVVPQQLITSLASANQLCMNSVAEPEGYRNALKYLIPYEKLLKALGVQALIIPSVKKRNVTETQVSAAEYLVSNYKRLRSENKMFDVVFCVREKLDRGEWREISTHKFALVAVSEYCVKHFTGPWGATLASGQKIRIEDISHKTLSSMIDFAYSGSMEWETLYPESDPQLIADRVDDLLDLLQGADMWFMSRLHELTEEHFLQHFYTYVRADNVEEVLEQVTTVRAVYLVEACKSYRDKNLDFVRRFRDGSEA